MSVECKVWPFEKDVILFDLETTSTIVDEARIIEIGAIKCVEDSGLICSRFHEYIDPGIAIPSSASRVNKIVDEMVAGKPSVMEVLPQFFEWGGNSIYSAYNLPYDESVINAELERYDLWPGIKPLWRFDMRVLAYRLIDPNVVSNYKLTKLAEYYGLNIDDAHSAFGDVEIMYQLLIKFILLWCKLETKKNFKDWMNTDFLLEYWPFGKHKGKKCRDLPVSFLQWATTEMVGDTLYTAKYWLESHNDKYYDNNICVICGSTFCVKRCCETDKPVCMKCRWVSPSGEIYISYDVFRQKVDRIIYGRSR